MTTGQKKDSGTELIVTGLGVGALGAVSSLVLGATCPLCVVAAPALLGAGLYEKWKAKRAPGGTSSGAPERAPDPGAAGRAGVEGAVPDGAGQRAPE